MTFYICVNERYFCIFTVLKKIVTNSCYFSRVISNCVTNVNFKVIYQRLGIMKLFFCFVFTFYAGKWNIDSHCSSNDLYLSKNTFRTWFAVVQQKTVFFVFKKMIFPNLLAKKVESAFSVCPLKYDSLKETKNVLPRGVWGH